MKKKITAKEIVLYIVTSIIAVTGLTFLILGIVADNISVDSILAKIQPSFKFRYIGLIIVAAAFLFYLIVALVFAKKSDRVIEKEIRRKQRLEAMKGNNDSDTILVQDGKIVEKKKESEEERTVDLKPLDNNKDIPNGNI